MMKLYVSANSPYARKARIVIRELALEDRVEEQTVSSLEELKNIGPNAKIPVLITEDHVLLCESLIIVRYLNDLSSGTLLPSEQKELASCLQLESISSAFLGSTFARSLETNQRKEDERSPKLLERERTRTKSCLDRLEELTVDFNKEVSLGSISIVCALGYANWRAPEDAWAEGRQNLKRYYDHFMNRDAFRDTTPIFNVN